MLDMHTSAFCYYQDRHEKPDWRSLSRRGYQVYSIETLLSILWRKGYAIPLLAAVISAPFGPNRQDTLKGQDMWQNSVMIFWLIHLFCSCNHLSRAVKRFLGKIRTIKKQQNIDGTQTSGKSNNALLMIEKYNTSYDKKSTVFVMILQWLELKQLTRIRFILEAKFGDNPFSK